MERLDFMGLDREYQIFFTGVLDLWVQHELSDAQLLEQVRYRILLRLLAVADGEQRLDPMRKVRKVHRCLHALDR